ncbi:MAG TPA: response regulator [Flavilitoribacter sp.]|mgnify:CR=1 FL=1|nr:response regulator [Flavilitoribacter sp.]
MKSNEQLKTLLVDDEKRSLETMQWLLEECCPDVEIIGMCESALKAIEFINQHQPDLLILDIAMPVMNGFDLITRLFPLPFSVLFVTAHNGPIVRILRKTGIPYLLKPVDDEELSAMIDRICQDRPLITGEQLAALSMGIDS